jgi:hypothetical protein
MIWDKLTNYFRGEIKTKQPNRLDLIFDQMQTPAAQEAVKKAFEATPEELGKAAVREAQIEEYKKILPYLKDKNKQFPHCNWLQLCAPTKCSYCDKYSSWQEERIANKVSFTGENKDGYIPCPSSIT